MGFGSPFFYIRFTYMIDGSLFSAEGERLETIVLAPPGFEPTIVYCTCCIIKYNKY